MPYTVTNSPGVEDDLSLIWINAGDRDAVAAASNQIDQLLKFAPDSVGADCGDHREITIAPLTVAYVLSLDDRMVKIIKVQLAEMS